MSVTTVIFRKRYHEILSMPTDEELEKLSPKAMSFLDEMINGIIVDVNKWFDKINTRHIGVDK